MSGSGNNHRRNVEGKLFARLETDCADVRMKAENSGGGIVGTLYTKQGGYRSLSISHSDSILRV